MTRLGALRASWHRPDLHQPTTLAGIVAAIRYIQIQARNDGTFMPHRIVFEFDRGNDDDGGKTMGWLDVFLDTMASATAALSPKRKARR